MPGAADLTLGAAARALRSGELGVVELADACLERAAAGRALGAFVAMAPGAREDAAALERELRVRGPRGALHGIPVAVKDIIDVAGMPTRGGSAVTDDAVAAGDAPLVARLRAAGAVIVGKTTTHELAFGTTTPAARNPWDVTRSPGGSSGGSAVAVAVGGALAALGTDTAGSVRIPAALCGVSGLKTRGPELPLEGVLPLAPSMDSAGPIARTADDLRILFDVLRGRPDDCTRRGGSALAADPSRLHIAVPSADPGADAETRAAVDRAVAALQEAGARVVSVDLPPWEAWERPRGRTLVAEALDAHRDAGWYPDRSARYGAQALGYLRYAERLTEDDREAARRELEALTAVLRRTLRWVSVLALPTTPVAAPPRSDDAGVARRDDALLTRLCGPANAANVAAVSVPCGLTAAGLPLGLQFVALREETALAAAAAHQRVCSRFDRLRPPFPAQYAADSARL